MASPGRWYEFTREKVSELSNTMVGIYFLSGNDKIPVYIGSSVSLNIRGRLMAHLRNNRCPKAKYFKYTIAPPYSKPKQMEAQAILKHVRKYKKFPIYIKAYPLLTELPEIKRKRDSFFL